MKEAGRLSEGPVLNGSKVHLMTFLLLRSMSNVLLTEMARFGMCEVTREAADLLEKDTDGKAVGRWLSREWIR